MGAAVADSAATDVAGLVSDYNALLASLRAAGIIATS
ncbi:head fiber protein [Klebsiella aerogenes]|nr:head fiber protein [Klebsiella aerogenes]